MTIEELFKREGKAIVVRLQQQFDKSGINASGSLSRTTEAIVTSDPSLTRLQIEINQYGTFIEPGRGPTKASGNGQLYDRIRKWIDDKGLSVPNGIKSKESLAWAITKKIHKEGTRAFPNKGPKVLTNVINAELVKEIEQKVANLVEQETLRQIDGIIQTRFGSASN